MKPTTCTQRLFFNVRHVSEHLCTQLEVDTLKITKCPKCNGKLQQIGNSNFFCVDCYWDNLPEIVTGQTERPKPNVVLDYIDRLIQEHQMTTGALPGLITASPQIYSQIFAGNFL